MVETRFGFYGMYYGNEFDSSNPLTYDQMEVNALYIGAYLIGRGWTLNAIAGLLGNMQVESSLNPGRWQSDRVGGDSVGHGYGLVQWTPYTKYTEWVTGDPSTMDNNLSRIIYEVDNNLQWIGAGEFSDMSFKEFSESELDPYTLGRAFILCYERPADQSEEAQNYRGTLATSWYNYLSSNNPTIPYKAKGKFNFILFRKKGKLYGKR